MAILHLSFDSKQILKIIDKVNAYNNSNENKRNYNDLLLDLSRTYFNGNNSLNLAQRTIKVNYAPNDTAMDKYELTVVPVWCDNLKELEMCDKNMLNSIFHEYFSMSTTAKPANMYQAKVVVNVLYYNFKYDEYDAIALPEFLNKIKQDLDTVLDYIN